MIAGVEGHRAEIVSRLATDLATLCGDQHAVTRVELSTRLEKLAAAGVPDPAEVAQLIEASAAHDPGLMIALLRRVHDYEEELAAPAPTNAPQPLMTQPTATTPAGPVLADITRLSVPIDVAPSSTRDRGIPAYQLRLVALTVAVALVAVASLLFLTRSHAPTTGPGTAGAAGSTSGTTGSASATPNNVAVSVAGTLTGDTAQCPGDARVQQQPLCILPVTVGAGGFRAHITWDTPDMLGIAMSNLAGQDVAPQMTGQRGSADLTVSPLAPGAYQLRIINVGAAKHAIHFTVTYQR